VNIIKKKVEASEQGMRLDRWLKRHFPQLNFVSVQKLVRTGQLRLEGKRTQVNAIVETGQEIRLPLFDDNDHHTVQKLLPTVSPQDLQAFKECIIFEDDDYLVINKPQGIAVQGGTNTEHHLDLILRTLWPDPAHCPKIIHRLDRDTSGVLVFAKNHTAVRWLGQAFHDKKVHKRYLAIVVGQMPASQGLIDAPMSKMGGLSKEKMTVSDAGDSAQTRYRVLRDSPKYLLSYVEFQPLTGRTHQIRVHANYLNCPILGDGKYGGKRAHALAKRTSICLHAAALSFKGPQGKNYHFNAPLPPHFQTLLNNCFAAKDD
jgi:23S rRNA pseudouridine955/2504/2580 synthase